MILLDTTVLVAYLRARSATLRAVLVSSPMAICGVTRAELLHGARNPADALALIAALDEFVQIPIDQPAWDEMGRNLSLLRSAGITVPFPDALIATVAIREKSELWTFDAHFQAMRSVLPGLGLFDGPKA
jgi:predicted nucleic acid-binding protein